MCIRDRVYTIEVQGSDKFNFVPISKIPVNEKGVGKWKIRKRISGGADRDKFVIKGGEPSSPSKDAQQKADESEGYLAFITPPDINNPTDHNRDNIYEVELSYINTIEFLLLCTPLRSRISSSDCKFISICSP